MKSEDGYRGRWLLSGVLTSNAQNVLDGAGQVLDTSAMIESESIRSKRLASAAALVMLTGQHAHAQAADLFFQRMQALQPAS